MKNLRKTLGAALFVVVSLTAATAQRKPRVNASAVPVNILVRIIRAEDERRWDDNLKTLLTDRDASVRRRAALAAGRIGNEQAVSALVELLRKDGDTGVRQMAAFALGEIESFAAADSLYAILGDTSEPRELSARVVEALGKIAAALPESEKDRKQELGKAILGVLSFEADSRVSPHRLTVLLGLTAALRARPDGAGPVIAQFLNSPDPRIVADALNTMARLRLKDASDRVGQLLGHGDPIVRANAARVIGAAEDKEAFDALLARALHDSDLRVRVSAIRALGNLKDARAVEALLERGEQQLAELLRSQTQDLRFPAGVNEVLEIATTVGRVLPNSRNDRTVEWVGELRRELELASPEVEIAFARVSPQLYSFQSVGSLYTPLFSFERRGTPPIAKTWQQFRNVAQGIAELATLKTGEKVVDTGIQNEMTDSVRSLLRCRTESKPASIRVRPGAIVTKRCRPLHEMARSDFLRAYAAFKPHDLGEILSQALPDEDVIVRATSAELLGEVTPSEANTSTLADALKVELPKTEKGELNDAALAILDALAKQKSAAANDAIKTALDSSDHLIRRRAVNLLKANGAGDFSDRIGFVKTRYSDVDYRRAIARIGRKIRATVVTSKGAFTIEFLPEDAPLTVDNFVMLARKGYFNGQTVPRVVPNFVIQTGDPRGDQNGGPGYSIRCEINQAPYDRAAVGMALSGKDTGGSQWFVTHSPQPHLDGGYTVFGRVISGMEVVDNIARGDTIRRVIVNER